MKHYCKCIRCMNLNHDFESKQFDILFRYQISLKLKKVLVVNKNSWVLSFWSNDWSCSSVKMGKICRRNSLFFFAGLLAVCAIGAITYALLSEEWVSCKIRRNLSNMTQQMYDAGWKKFGLIRGCEEIKPFKFGGSVRDKCFQGIAWLQSAMKVEYIICHCMEAHKQSRDDSHKLYLFPG